jgi:hypothetical protein
MKRQALPLLVLATALTLMGCGDEKTSESGGGASGAGGGINGGSSAGGAGASSLAGADSAGVGTGTGGGVSSSGAGAGGGAGTAGATDNGDFPSLNLTDDARKLSDEDKGLLCDWVNDTLGGYGLATNCGTIITSNDRDQAQCVQTRFRYNCKVTVQEVKDCTLATAPSHACNTDFQECHALRCIE